MRLLRIKASLFSRARCTNLIPVRLGTWISALFFGTFPSTVSFSLLIAFALGDIKGSRGAQKNGAFDREGGGSNLLVSRC